MLVVRRSPIIKLASRLHLIYTFYSGAKRFEMRFSPQLDKVIPKCIWNNKEPRIAEAIVKKKEEEEEGKLTLPDLNNCYKALNN